MKLKLRLNNDKKRQVEEKLTDIGIEASEDTTSF